LYLLKGKTYHKYGEGRRSPGGTRYQCLVSPEGAKIYRKHLYKPDKAEKEKLKKMTSNTKAKDLI